jgi:hypothetical protein
MRPWITTLLILGCVASLFYACYGRAIFQGEQFAYRDAAHYYYPLHARVQAEWDAGRWPLWEPEENGGMPLLGNPTAAVLYPGKVVFALFGYPLAARLYVMGHTLLAFGAMLALLRHWGTGWVGSSLGALGYAFGGPVLFQYCNVIYLVGAAWLPLGFRAVDGWLRLGRRRALVELAVVLAMETLGGDPESAYLTGLCALGYAAGLSWGGPKKAGPVVLGSAVLLMIWVVATLAVDCAAPIVRPVPPAGQPQPPLAWSPWIGPVVAAAWWIVALLLLARWRRLRTRKDGSKPVLVPMLAGLVGAACVAAALSAAQLFPVLEFTGQSGRAASEGAHDIYPFSLNPLRVVELVWPNAFGTGLHGNKLWLAVLPPRDPNVRVWVPTLYLGGLTLVLALGGAPPVPGAPWRAWMAAVAVAGLLGSFGEYGSPLWLAREIPGAASLVGPHNPGDAASALAYRHLRDGDGGVYWLLATALPGFGRFRFPSKLLTFTVLGLTALAAQGWDALVAGDPRVRRRTALWSALLLLLTVAALGLSITRRGEFRAWLQAQGLTSMFGPFDAAGAVAETQRGLVQAALMFAFALVLAGPLVGRRPTLAGALALAATTADLACANAWMIATVPQPVMDATPEVVSIIARAEREKPMPGPYRVHRVPVWGPIAWSETASPDRVGDFVAWERRTAEPKYGINFGIHYTMTLGVAQLHDHEWFFGGFFYRARERAARALGVEPGTELIVYPRRAFDMWNTRYFVLPYYARWQDEFRGIASFIDRTERIFPPPGAFEGPGGAAEELAWVKNHDFQVRRNLDEFPRAWVVHEARALPALGALSRAGRNVRMQEMLFSNDMTWPDPDRNVYHPRRYVWLEDSDVTLLAPYLAGGRATAGEVARVVHSASDRVAIEAVLERPGIVVLSDVDYPGWTLTIDGRAAPLYRANSLMRAAAVGAGQHMLVYTYRPASFRIGLVVSGLGLPALGLLGYGPAVRRLTRQPVPPPH